MELTNEFVIDRNVDETWEILNDLEFIAPCMPGAQLQEIEGEEYRGVVKIKVGPISAQYKGKASFIEQDVENKVAKLKAEGRDPRQGNANAMVTARMEPAGEGQTTVNIHTDLGLSGKIASFGRGAIEDVSKKILGQFTDNLRDKLEEGAAPAADGATESTTDTAATATATATAATDGGGSGEAAEAAETAANGAVETAAASTGVRKIDGPEAEPVDVLAVSSGAMAKRLVPAGGALAVVAFILYLIFGRG
ncbi:MAG: SRPBCC family protein [Actinomycetota bacterium]